MENKQTAVELLAILIYSDCQFGGTLDNRISIDKNYLEEIIEQAKEMEKDRLFHSFYAGGGVDDNEDFKEQFEQYYNETYGK